MSVISSALKHMLAAGMPHDVIVAAVAEMEADLARDPVAEKRRAYDRERRRAERASRVSTGHPPTSEDSADAADIADTAPFPYPPNEINSNPPTHTPGNKPRARKAVDFTPPSRIPAEAWDGYVAMRVRIRKPMTPYAMKLAVEKLDKLAEAGWPPGDVLNHSTMNSYQGLFPPKDDQDHNHVAGHRNSGGGRDRRPDGFTAALREVSGR